MKTRRSGANPQLEEIDKLRTTLRKAEAEVQRLLDEAAARGALVDILHDVMGSLSMDELFHMLARRLARALNLSDGTIKVHMAALFKNLGVNSRSAAAAAGARHVQAAEKPGTTGT